MLPGSFKIRYFKFPKAFHTAKIMNLPKCEIIKRLTI